MGSQPEEFLKLLNEAYDRCAAACDELHAKRIPPSFTWATATAQMRQRGDQFFQTQPAEEKKKWNSAVQQFEAKYRTMKRHLGTMTNEFDLPEMPVLLWDRTPEESEEAQDDNSDQTNLDSHRSSPTNPSLVTSQLPMDDAGTTRRAPAINDTVHSDPVFKAIDIALKHATEAIQLYMCKNDQYNYLEVQSRGNILESLEPTFGQIAHPSSDLQAQTEITNLQFKVKTALASIARIAKKHQEEQARRDNSQPAPVPRNSTQDGTGAPTPPPPSASTIHNQTTGPVDGSQMTFQFPPGMDTFTKSMTSFAETNNGLQQEKRIKIATEKLQSFEKGTLEYIYWKEALVPYLKLETDQFRKYQTIKALLKGQALEEIKNILASRDNAGDLVMQQLEEAFASPQKIIQAHREGLEKLPVVYDFKPQEMKSFVTKVETIIEALGRYDKNPMGEHLFASTLVSKVDIKLYAVWQDRAIMTGKKEEDPIELLKFLKERAHRLEAAACCAHGPKQAECKDQTTSKSQGKKNSTSAANQNKALVANETPGQGVPGEVMHCLMCNTKKQHWTSRCEKLKPMTIAQRLKFAMDNKLHFRCFSKHPRGKCPVKDQNCTRGCPQQHHQLLCKENPWNKKNDQRAAGDKENSAPQNNNRRVTTTTATGTTTGGWRWKPQQQQQQQQRKSKPEPPDQARPAADVQDVPDAANIANDQMNESDSAFKATEEFCISVPRHIRLLPIIVRKQNGKPYQVTAAIDSGCTRTLIDEDVAKRMGLECKDLSTYLLEGIHGSFQELQAVVTFEVAPVSDPTKFHQLKAAKTKKNLRFTGPDLPWKQWAQKQSVFKDLPLHDVQYSGVRILLGLDAEDLTIPIEGSKYYVSPAAKSEPMSHCLAGQSQDPAWPSKKKEEFSLVLP